MKREAHSAWTICTATWFMPIPHFPLSREAGIWGCGRQRYLGQQPPVKPGRRQESLAGSIPNTLSQLAAGGMKDVLRGSTGGGSRKLVGFPLDFTPRAFSLCRFAPYPLAVKKKNLSHGYAEFHS